MATHTTPTASAPILCECGCGLPAPIAKNTNRAAGVVAGQPQRFLRGHGNRPGFRGSPAESFLEAYVRQRTAATTLAKNPPAPGLCQCGCGRPAHIAKKTNSRRGTVKGQPTRYALGHHPRRGRRQVSTDLIGQYWSLVQILGLGSAPGSCWIYTGPVSKDGYGRFSNGATSFLAHRVAWELVIGPIPPGFQVNHGPCDNRRCVSPYHLFLGFQEVNVRDCASKGRIARKLRPSQVVEARTLHQEGWKIAALAERFSCSPVTMNAVITEESWVHLTAGMMSIPIQAATKGQPWVTTPDLVEAIGADYATGATQRTIAKQYGTSKTTVARILRAAVPAQDRRARVLTRAQAQQILDLHRAGETLKSIAARFGVSGVTVGHIARGKTFKALEGPRTPSERLKPADVQAIRRLRRDGVAPQVIATRFEVSWYTIRRILTGRTWKHLEEAA
jgi:uncharacterized protein YerC